MCVCVCVCVRYTRSVLSCLGFPNVIVNAYSCRPSPRYHIAGKLSIGYRRAILQDIAFILVYALKIVFEYYVVCKPLVTPVSQLHTHTHTHMEHSGAWKATERLYSPPAAQLRVGHTVLLLCVHV